MTTDPHHFFEQLFEFSNDPKKADECERCLYSLNKSLSEEQLDKDYLDIYVLHIFHPKHGLLQFIEINVQKKLFKNTLKQALEIVFIITKNCSAQVSHKNILDIYSLATKIIKSNTDAIVKSKLFELLMCCLQINDRCMDKNESVAVFQDLLKSLLVASGQTHSNTVKDKELIALGYLVKKFSYFIEDSQLKQIKSIFERTFAKEILSNKKSQHILEGVFTGFMHFCDVVKLKINEDSRIIKMLYAEIRTSPDFTKRMKVANRAAINFFSQNLKLFKDRLLIDYKYWHTTMLKWLMAGNEEQKAGFAFLNSFVKELGFILVNKTGHEHKAVINYFTDWSQRTINDPGANHYEIRLAVSFFKLLSAAINKHLEKDDLTQLFLFIERHFEENYVLKFDPKDEHWEFLPDYIQAFTTFIQFKEFSSSDFFCLQRGTINMIKSFPDIHIAQQYMVIDGMAMTFCYIKKTKYFDMFLENVVYQGVIWSCSAEHISMASTSSEQNSEKIVTVNSYLNFWKGILDINFIRKYDEYGFSLEDRKYIMERLVHELVKTLDSLLNKLNVSVTPIENDLAVTDFEQAFKVDDKIDYNIFLNVVDFYQKMFDHVESKWLRKFVSKIISDMINKSLKNSLVSGFYKLLSFGLNIAKKLSWFDESNEDQDVLSCIENMRVYLPLLLNSMMEFKDELLISCLQVLLETPIVLIKEILPVCEGPFINIFTIGKTDLQLTIMGIETLEYWQEILEGQETIDQESLDTLVIKVLPYLDSFLRSKSLGGQGNVSMEKRRKTSQALKKRKIIVELEPELLKVQRKILNFIGKQNLKNCREFIFSNDEILSDMSSGQYRHLKLALPFQDVHFDIHLEAFLYRIVDLALHCTDRKTRTTACELLQATVMVFLGIARSMSAGGILELNGILKIIAMPVLQLGCDVDPLVKQIFQPLFIQLIHWYTSPRQIRSPHTAIIIDTLTEGITHSTNSSLRDFSGESIREFIKWTIKHSDEDALYRDPINIKVFVKKMRYFSTHPDKSKKLGCALIFNNIYRELREENVLISIFWLDILHIIVNSLASYENVGEFNETAANKQCKKAIKHLQRVFIEKAFLFRKPDAKRRVPNDLNEGLMKDVVVWLLEQSGSTSKDCRECCMELFLSLAPLVNEKPLKLQAFIQANFTTSVLNVYTKRLSEFPKDGTDCSVLFKWMKSFLCALDGYLFVIKNNLIDVHFGHEDNVLFCSQLNFFLEKLQDIDFIGAINLMGEKSWIFKSVDKELFNYLKFNCILAILKLFNSFVTVDPLIEKTKVLWHKNVWKLMGNSIFLPHLSNNNLISRSKFEEILSNFLAGISHKLPKGYLSEFINYIESHYLSDREIVFKDFNLNLLSTERDFVNGLLFLSRFEISQVFSIVLNRFSEHTVHKLVDNFQKGSTDNKIVLKQFNQTTITYIEQILAFSLKNKTEYRKFLEYLFSSYTVESIEYNEEVYFGTYILKSFSNVVIPFIINDFELFLQTSINLGDTKKMTEFVTYILSYLVKEKTFQSKLKDVTSSLIQHWDVFEKYFDSSNNNIEEAVAFLKIIANNSNHKMIHDWLIKCLLQGNNFGIFELLVSTTTEEFAKESTSLANCLHIFGNRMYGETSADCDNDKNVEQHTVMINKTLSLFPMVKSSIVAKFLIQKYLTLPTNLDITDLFIRFIRNTDDFVQAATLSMICQMIFDENDPFQKRYKLAKDILPHIMRYSNKNVIITFSITNLSDFVQNFTEVDQVEKKILTFIYIEALFEVLNPEEVESLCKEISQPCQSLLAPALDAFKNQNKDEIYRIYRCYGYKAMVSAISNFPKFRKLYIKLFIRYDNNKEILWNGIVDTNKTYNFKISFEAIPKMRKVLLSIRDELNQSRQKEENQAGSLRYIASQKLFSSSLSEDITDFDFTNSIVRKEPPNADQINNEVDRCKNQRVVYLEAIEVNNHECMATVCGFIRHIFDSGITDLPSDDDNIEFPEFMDGIRNTLLDPKTHPNVKIFLVKVIDNLFDIFTHYSKWFIEPLLQFIVDKCAGDAINYFVTDVLVMLTKWAPLNGELSEKEYQLSSELIHFLVDKINRDRVDVFKYNLDNIKLIVESWKTFMKLPTELVFSYIASGEKCDIGLNLAYIFLVNNLKLWVDDKSETFLDLLLKKLNCDTKALYKLCAEVIGLFLHKFGEDEHSNKVDKVLKQLRRNNSDLDKYVLCLEGIAIQYPPLINGYHICNLISMLNQCKDEQRLLCLKIILKRLQESLEIMQEVTDFQIVEWNRLLEHPNLGIQITTLGIIMKALSTFMDFKVFSKIMSTLSINVHHSDQDFRNLIYEVAFLIYEQNRKHVQEARDILIIGLVDTSEENKEKVTNIWKEQMNLPSLVVDRFSYILSELYIPKTEDNFLGFANYFLINLISCHDKFNDLLFEHPLEDCEFEDYQLQTNWRLQNPSVVPLFAETFQTVDPSAIDHHNIDFRLRQTLSSMNFAPTQNSMTQTLRTHSSLDSSLAVTFSNDTTFKNPNSMNMSVKYRQRRFLKDKGKTSREFAHYEIKKREQKLKKRVDIAQEREKKVVIYRNYRKGDFPDIQITLSAVLTPLQMLALQDNEISKILFLELFNGINSNVQNNDDFLKTISTGISRIFNSSTSYNPYVTGAMLDILLKNTSKIRVDPQLIVYACQESGLISVGTLLLEEYILNEDSQPSGSKKGTATEQSIENLCWVKLAELYKHLEEWDVVQAIFLEKMGCSDVIQDAIRFESESLWRNAQDCYYTLITTDISPERKDFYYDSYFKCFANLGEWLSLPDAIASVVETKKSTWDNLWDGDWNQQKLLPWYIQAQVKNCLCKGEEGDFFENINASLSDPSKKEYLKSHFSEELCMVALFQKDVPLAKVFLSSFNKYFLSDWQCMSPTFQSLRYNKLLKLHGVTETKELMTIYENLSEESTSSLLMLTKKLEKLSNEIFPSVMISETRHVYRSHFADIFIDKLSSFTDVDCSDHKKKLELTKIKMDLNLVNLAADLNNFHLARKYFRSYSERKHPKLSLALGNISLAKSKMLGPKDELDCYLQAQKMFGEVLTGSQDQMLLLNAGVKLFDVNLRISELMTGDMLNKYRTMIKENLGYSPNCHEDVALYGFNQLQKYLSNCNESMDCNNDDNKEKHNQIANAYVKLAYYIRNKNKEDLQREFILFILRAMKMDSSEGRQLFPCVIMQNNLNSEFKDLFVEEVENIPTWMFLGWIPQLLAYLNSDKIFALSPIIERIAEAYPQAIMFPYRLSKESLQSPDNEVIREELNILMCKLDKLLLSNELIEKFVMAFSYVCVPAAMLKYDVEKMIRCQQKEEIEHVVDHVITNVLTAQFESKNVNNMQGNMYKKINKYKREFEKLSKLNLTKTKDNLSKLLSTLKTELNDLKEMKSNSSLLKDYCPWLANFSGNKLNAEIEIPGQYDGKKRPLPHHHVKISRFHMNVSVLKSIRKPIKITILGMDTKEYPFLVKFGEDLRQDQRIEQLFSLMNDIYKSDTKCTNSGLQVLTYQVIPFTTNLGLVQWIDSTETIGLFMEKCIKNNKINQNICDNYYKWLPKGSLVEAHGNCAQKYSRDKITAYFRSVVNRIPHGILRKSFESISTNTESFLALRNNFTKTYSVLCISQWILGIGDRHLENSLICIKNGQVLGIDFGHAFGTATQILPVPELVPIRLTPHLVEFLGPVQERGQFRANMIHCLKALRTNYNSLLATMSVFIEEPSLDWLEHAARFENVEKSNLENWYPKVKVDQIRRKLQGTSSTAVLIEDLSAGRSKFSEAYIKLVKGDIGIDKRTKLSDENLTAEEQVECLLDHAMDYNLLGRMYGGWNAWV